MQYKDTPGIGMILPDGYLFSVTVWGCFVISILIQCKDVNRYNALADWVKESEETVSGIILEENHYKTLVVFAKKLKVDFGSAHSNLRSLFDTISA